MITDKQTKVINGNSYEVSYMPALYNTNLFVKFSSLVGSALPKLFGAFNSTGDMALVGDAINSVMTSLYVNDPKNLIILEIMSKTKRNGADVTVASFDQMYTGNIGEMTQALLFSIEVHFKHFLPLELISGLLTKTDQDQVISAENSTKI